ncbi:MAG TPA: hypothetical protein VFS05_02320 [Gemmatimonadaceae bacterium]|nr:hypothetical protein [Gemmatimonadaceae bacterium]
MRPIAALTLLIPCLAACGTRDEPSPGDTRGAVALPPSAAPIASARGSGAATGASVAEERGVVPIAVTAMIGARTLRARGRGECTHTTTASIYGVPAAMWSVHYAGTGEVAQLGLTVWQPKEGGAAQVNLSLRSGSDSRRIATVKGGEMTGSASVTITSGGAGGRLEVVGRDATGTPLRATVECERFTEPVVEGG